MNPKDLFDHLDEWRHLPAYQLERRADIFFALYLPEICAKYCGCTVTGMVPEFPIRRGNLVGTEVAPRHANLSNKIDYLLTTHHPTIPHHGLILELKTDDGSRNTDQDDYLGQAKTTGLRRLVAGVLTLRKATDAKHKYDALLSKLNRLGLLAKQNNQYTNTVNEKHQLDLWYIQPNIPKGAKNVISFLQVAEVVDSHKDEFSQRFVKSLKLWASRQAGNVT